MEMQRETTIQDYAQHLMRPETVHDEDARSNFMMDMYRHLGRKAGEGRRDVYEKRVKPAFIAEHGRAPKDRHEVREAVLKDPYFQYWGHLRVLANQNLFHDNSQTVERQLDDLIERAKPRGKTKGQLDLDPNFEIPKYQASLDMHWMPGSFYTETDKGDVAAGAMYDSGGLYVMTSGMLGPHADGGAYSVINYLKERYPNFKPKRILDEGCTVGHNTLPYKEAYPKAEVIGIDIGAPVLRYAHARAEDLGVGVTFAQQNAEHTKYEDESFDLVTSTMFLHETSRKAIHNIFAEGYRLLKKGGLMLHVEQPPFRWFEDPFEQHLRDWDTHNNNEPFWGPMHDMDLTKVAVENGFKRKDIAEEMAELVRPTKTDKYAKGPGGWYVFAAWKR